jgi:hypothetical protein
MTKYLIVCSLVLSTFYSQAQTAVFRSIEKHYEQAYIAFLYPSTLRALNLSRNEDLDKLVEGIEEAAYVRIEKPANFVPASLFAAMITDLGSAGFIELMSMQGPNQKFAIMSLGEDNPKAFVILMEDAESLSILDIQGAIELSLLTKIDQLDITSFQDILKQNDK